MRRFAVSQPTSVSRFEVRSRDGTSIAVWVEGQGPPIVMVHGAISDHTRFGPLAEHLGNDLTMFSLDRRGRGASGDGPAYAIEREFEDVAAVVDAVAERTGARVALFGHSYGADCVMGGAALTGNAGPLVLYEPGLGTAYPAGAIQAAKDSLAAGDREGAIVRLLTEVLGATEAEIEGMRTSPIWPSRLATAPTLPRELEAEDAWVYSPGQFEAVRGPVLVLAGSESPPVQDEATQAAVAALPGAKVRVLEGQGHFAIQTDPALVARVIREFVLG
jgi:pimeloyl-ACP methyl ester carboxylesterase